jgi:hypothetical protein
LVRRTNLDYTVRRLEKARIVHHNFIEVMRRRKQSNKMTDVRERRKTSPSFQWGQQPPVLTWQMAANLDCSADHDVVCAAKRNQNKGPAI